MFSFRTSPSRLDTSLPRNETRSFRRDQAGVESGSAYVDSTEASVGWREARVGLRQARFAPIKLASIRRRLLPAGGKLTSAPHKLAPARASRRQLDRSLEPLAVSLFSAGQAYVELTRACCVSTRARLNPGQSRFTPNESGSDRAELTWSRNELVSA